MDWPLIGRETELERVAESLRHFRPVVLTGPAGIGKTCLASRALEFAREELGCKTESASATRSAASIPFGALAHLLPVPEEGGTVTGRAELLRRARGELVERAGDDGLVLSVDDAHLLDHGSAALVHHLAATDEVNVLVTVRSGEPVSDAVTALWKDGEGDRITLGPLDRDAADTLAEAVLGGPAGRALLEEVWRLSEGNPLFLRELLVAGMGSGRVVDGPDGWSLAQGLEANTRLQLVLAARLRALQPAPKRLLDFLAFADVLSVTVAEAQVGAEGVEAAVDSGIVRAETSGRRCELRFAHPLYGELVRAELSAPRQRRIASQLAAALEQTGAQRKPDLLLMGTWRLRSGRPGDPGLLTAAAERALAALDYPLAEQLARAAVDGGGGFDARLALGKAMSWQNRVEEGDQELAAAEAMAQSDADGARTALARAHSLFFRAAEADRAAEILKSASAAVSDHDWRDELDASIALFSSISGDLHEAADMARRVLGRPEASDRTLRSALAVALFSHVLLGRFDEAAGLIELALAHSRSDSFFAAELFGAYQAMLEAYSGRAADAQERATAGFSRAASSRPDVGGPWGDVLCHILILRGKPVEAARVGRETMGLLHRGDPFGVAGMTLAGWAYAAALGGDREDARRLLGRVSEHQLPVDVRPGIFAAMAEARLQALEGAAPAGARLAASEGRRVVEGGHLVWGGFLLHESVRLGHAEAVVEDLDRVAGRVDGALFPLLARHARALALADAPGLAAAAEEFAAMGVGLHAAEAAAQAAEAFGKQGSDSEARRWTTRTLVLLRECPGAVIPGARMPDKGLTAREQEIALMAAGGLSSREIAERLTVSRRTVDNHLAAVYRKLGIDGREGLAQVLALPDHS